MSGKVDRGTPVLVDTNVIIESHRVGAWKALAGGYWVETVEDCLTETQTGFQWRRREESIVVGALRGTLAAEHAVGDRERAELAVRVAGIALDRGEGLIDFFFGLTPRHDMLAVSAIWLEHPVEGGERRPFEVASGVADSRMDPGYPGTAGALV